MSKFKNLVDQLRQKRLEGVVSVDSVVEAKVEKVEKVVAEEKPVATETKVNSAPKPKQTKKRKGK